MRLEAKWPSVKQVLECIANDGNVNDPGSISMTLIMRMETYGFVLNLHLMKLLLGLTNELSLTLQERDQNIIQAMHLIKILKLRLQDLRENGWNSFMQEVKLFCEANMIEVPNMDDLIETRLRQRRDRQRVTNDHHYRREIFYEVIDLIAMEMENRFPEISTELLTCVACLDPRDSFSKFDLGNLLRLSELYPSDFSELDRKLLQYQLENYIYDVRCDSGFSAIQNLETLSKKMVATGKARSFPLVYRLIELALLLPVATASVERVFSAMKLVKTDARNRMCDEWMNDSLVVYIEKKIFNSIDDERILRRFQEMKTRNVLLPPLRLN